MAESLKLTIACDDFETVLPLKRGEIAVEGVELEFQPEMSNPERHRRMVRDLAFDICELNICPYLVARSHDAALTALPVFLFRKFRHGNIFINPSSSIKLPPDLIGKRVGSPHLQSAGNVWVNGILKDEHGIDTRTFRWLVERGEDVEFERPADIKVDRIAAGETAVSMLMKGQVDAVITPTVPKPLIEGDPRIARLFPDYVEREKSYFRRTGIFPIMHVTAIRADVVRRHPWVVPRLVEAFERAKSSAYRRLADTRVVPQAWFGATWEEERCLLGSDPWSYGLTDSNRRNIETIVRYTHEQGMIARRPAVDELFVL